MANFDSLIARQKEILLSITRTHDNYKKLVREKRTQPAVESRIKNLERNWSKFDANNDRLHDIKTDSTQTHLYFTDGLFAQGEEAYQDQLALLMQELALVKHDAADHTEKTASSSPSHSLPNIPLPHFSGNYHDWAAFRDLFQAMVHENKGLSDVERHQYLRAHVSGEALQLISNMSITGDNFSIAWNALDERYNHRRVLITSHLDTIFKQPPLTRESAVDLKNLLFSTNKALGALESLKLPVDQWDCIIVYQVARLLDPHTRREWELFLGDTTNPATYSQLKTFLNARIRALEVLKPQSQSPISQSTITLKPPKAMGAKVHSAKADNLKCACCDASHYISSCPRYKEKAPKQRRDFVLKKQLCFNCLGPHQVKSCRSQKRCFSCGLQHHSSLHDTFQSSETDNGGGPSPPKGSLSQDVAASSVNHASLSSLAANNGTRLPSVLLATALVEAVGPQNLSTRIRVLLDQGSELSFVRESVVQTLKLNRHRADISLSGIGARHSDTTRGVVELRLRSLSNSSFIFNVQAYVLPKLTGLVPSVPASESDVSHLLDLELADPHYSIPGMIDVILGADAYGSIIKPGLRQGGPGKPIAQETAFGWVISGPTKGNSQSMLSSIVCSTIISDEDRLDSLVERFWETEQVPPQDNQPLTPEEERCEFHFKTTHTRDQSGRYIVRLPLRTNITSLGNSRWFAEQALKRTRHRIQSNAFFGKLYKDFLSEYEDLGHMSTATALSPNSSRSFFLPHHGVLRESSSSTRLRVVFNGSQKTTLGTSLNDALLPGPKLQTDLVDVILRWRRYPIAFSADVEKMYRQILVHDDDRDLQRILWTASDHEEIKEYRLNTVTYGLTSAPYLALRVIRQLVADEGSRFPLAASAVHNEMYVDDILSGAYNINSAQEKVRQLYDLLMAGGFRLHKWASSEPEALHAVTQDCRNRISTRVIEECPTLRTLGLSWRMEDDQFIFPVNSSESLVRWTKRRALSLIARLFDPLGWLAPFVVTAKILLQRMWTTPIGWDDPLPPPILESWLSFHQDLAAVSELSIPRWFGTTSSDAAVEIHGFSDASLDAMAACVYLRVLDTGAHIPRSTLIAAKTRVAPIKRMTVPRLELSAAVLLARLIAKVRSALELFHAPIYTWTDSTVALYWLQGPAARWQDFVSNRVSLVLDLLPQAIWGHVPGSQNPADIASRGLPAAQLQLCKLWWQGPSWLKLSPDFWPSTKPSQPRHVNLEERVRSLTHTTTTSTPEVWNIIHRFSRLSRLLRVTGWIVRAAIRFRRSTSPEQSLTLSVSELQAAQRLWIIHTQRVHFSNELSLLKKGLPISKSSSLKSLTPFVDHEGILRVGGRLKNSALDSDSKHPAILPPDAALTKLIVDDAHRRNHHGGVQLTLADIRQKFWILRGRGVVKTHLLRCVTCARHRAQLAKQLMGQLPRTRVSPSRPFLNSGVDYAGPFSLKTWRGRSPRLYKAYLIVFVCFSTSAVHLELATDYSTEGFLAAYRRFCGRRGSCASITSDCGTNFVGADAELKRLFRAASKELNDLTDALSLSGTQWHFNPPGAPHFGGKWEAAVKSVKFHLRRIIGDTKLTYEEFSTVLTQIEGILNSRPLCPISDDPDDLEALTPGHFLIGQPINSFPEPSLSNEPTSRLSRWQLMSQITQRFWQRWSREYLQRLQGISKWHSASPAIKIGTLVLIVDERHPPTSWPMARIVSLHPGTDGLPRVATLKTSSSTCRRPIVKLCPLPVETSS